MRWENDIQQISGLKGWLCYYKTFRNIFEAFLSTFFYQMIEIDTISIKNYMSDM